MPITVATTPNVTIMGMVVVGFGELGRLEFNRPTVPLSITEGENCGSMLGVESVVEPIPLTILRGVN
jgi:hypothetical protein